jgi:predicted MFS family arabinose efflux permease
VGQLAHAEPAKAGGAGGASIWRKPGAWLLEAKLSREFWVFFAVAFIFDFGFSIYFFLFNLFLLDFHFNERTMGLVGGALTFGSMIGTLPAGWLARRTGLRPMLMFCMIAAPLLGAVRTTIMWEPAQIGLGFLAGLAMCIWGVCFLPAVARLTTQENRASAFSITFSMNIGAGALGGLVCSYLPQWLKMAGYAMRASDVKRLILLIACAIASTALIPLLRLRLPLEESQPQASDNAGKQPWKMNPFLRRFLPSMALWTVALTSFTPFASVYLARNLNISLSHIGLIFTATGVIQFCLGLLTPLLFRTLGLVKGIVATQVATAAAMACLAGTHDRRLAVALYLSFSATQWMSSPGLYNLLMSRVPGEERSSASAMTMFCNALVGAAATAGAGLLFVRFGYPHVLVGIAGFAAVAAVLFWMVVGQTDPSSRIDSQELIAQ